MLLHRNIGAEELLALVRDKVVYGTYDITDEKHVIGVKMENRTPVVSFFASDYWWVDDNHTFEIWVDIPDYKLIYGTGIYYSDENFEKTHVWNGRGGDIRYEVPEAYATEYTIMDIRLIKPAKKPLRNIVNDMIYEWTL